MNVFRNTQNGEFLPKKLFLKEEYKNKMKRYKQTKKRISDLGGTLRYR